MKKAYEIGEDVQEEEKKRKRENIIMWVLSAVLFILPGAGQALSAFTRIAMIGCCVLYIELSLVSLCWWLS